MGKRTRARSSLCTTRHRSRHRPTNKQLGSGQNGQAADFLALFFFFFFFFLFAAPDPASIGVPESLTSVESTAIAFEFDWLFFDFLDFFLSGFDDTAFASELLSSESVVK